MNRKGSSFLIGIVFVMIGFIILMALSPAIESLASDLKTNSTFNCKTESALGSDSDNPNENTLGCTIADLITPLLILGVIMSGIMIIYYGKSQQPEQYPSYGGGY